MGDPSILQRVEEGTVDFRTAFEAITSAGTNSSPQPFMLPAGTAAELHRSDAGRLILSDVDAVDMDAGDGSQVARINLIPVERVWLDDGLSEVPQAGGTLVHTSSEEGKSMGSVEVSAAGDVVELTYPEPGIALVTLRDEANRNMFSEGLIRGVPSGRHGNRGL